jgi:hypothetical protein
VYDQILPSGERSLKGTRVVPSILVTYMNTTATTADLLTQIAQIQCMERGKLSAYTFQARGPAPSPYYKLQAWEDGKNLTRYIRAEQVPLVEEALAGHARFQELVAEYEQLIIEQTRERLAAVGVKKKPGRRPTSSWRKSRKSSN